jgi:hypothetical protein
MTVILLNGENKNLIKWWEQEYKYTYNVLKSLYISVISGFSCQVDENCTLLDFYKKSNGNFLLIFWDNPSVPYW